MVSEKISVLNSLIEKHKLNNDLNTQEFAQDLINICAEIARKEHWKALEEKIDLNHELKEFNRGVVSGKKIAYIDCYRKIKEHFDV